MKLTIILIARRDLQREALSAMLTDAGFQICAYDPAEDNLYGSFASSVAQYQVALIDARIPNVLNEIASLSKVVPTIKIALITENGTADFIRRAFVNGAAGVIDRKVSFAIFVCQLELLALGGCVVPSGLVEKLTTPPMPILSDASAAAANRLSGRERQIVQCIASGMSNKVIARQLHLSEPTVKVHVGTVLRKLNLENRTKVAVWATCLGAE